MLKRSLRSARLFTPVTFLCMLPWIAQASICSRTEQVRDAIIAKLPGNTDCSAITDTDLAGVTGALALNGKSIAALKAGDFDGLTGLSKLELHYNSLNSLPAGIFDELNSLGELNLYDNDLSSLPENVFDRLTGLTNLNLGRNRLSNLPAGVFDNLTGLTALGLHANRNLVASSLTSVFDKLAGLTALNLNASNLSSLPAGVFDGLTSLIHLHMNSNNLGSLPAGVFDKPTGLTFLDLSRNNLTGFRTGVFDKLSMLSTLNLDDNHLSSLPEDVFDKLTGLKVLLLSNNRLSRLPEDGFARLSSLAMLWLQNNELGTLPSGVFAKLYSLGVLDLSGNSGLSCLPVMPGSLWKLALDKKKNAYAACGAATRVEPTCLAVAAGAMATYTVALGAAPNRYANSGNVTVTPASSDSGTATVLPAKLNFTIWNWAKAQTVTVTGEAVGSATISHNVSGGGYDSATASNVAVPVGLVLTPAPTRPAATAGDASVRLSGAYIAHNCGPSAIVKWQYRYKSKAPGGSYGEYGSWVDVTGTSSAMPVTMVAGLTNGTEYRFKVRAVNDRGGGAESDASDAVTPAPVSLTASDVTATTAKLAIANWSEAWSFKGDYISCTNVAAGTGEVNLSGLTPGTDYLVFAYGAHNCPVNDRTWPRPRSVIFTALLRKVEGIKVTAGGGSLSVGWTAQSYWPGSTGYHVQWKSETQDWSSGRQSDAATNSATISGLTGGVSYTVRVRSYHKGYLDRIKYGEWSDTATGTTSVQSPTPPAPGASTSTLTASAVEATTATLTVGDHSGSWYYRRISPDDGACSPQVAAGTATASLTGLSPATRYIFAAYSDSACLALLATAPAFLTKPGQVTGVALMAYPARLEVSWTALTGVVTGYMVQWRSGYRSYDAARQNDVPSGTRSSIAGLTDGTTYTVRVAAYNATGGGAWSTEATGKPGGRASLRARLARVNRALAPEAARATLSSSVEAISERIRQRLSGEAGPPPGQALQTFIETRGQGLSDGALALREALDGASVSLPLVAGKEDGGLSSFGAGVWASGDWRRLSGGGRVLEWDGSLAVLHMGADMDFGRSLLGGFALSVSEAAFDYTDRSGNETSKGDWTTRMTGVHPYAAHLWDDGSRFWTEAGVSSGTVEIRDAKTGRQEADSKMVSLSVGGALRLLPADAGMPSLDLKADGFVARFETENNGDLLEAVDMGISRLRFALAGEVEMTAGPGAVLSPSAELGLRWDGGDGQTGLGAELGGGFSYAVAAERIVLNARARALFAHESEREEWGLGAGLHLDPDASGHGPSFGFRVFQGDTGSAAARLWDEGVAGGIGPASDRLSVRLEAKSGYGMPAPGVPGGLLTPWAGLGLEDDGLRRYRTGVRLELDPAFAISLEGVCSKTAGGRRDQDAMLRLDMRW